MHFSYWMILVAGLLPYFTVALAKASKHFDNANPRAYLANLTGWRARADAAHKNHFEAFPFFAAAVIVAQLKGTSQHTIDVLAALFVGARIAYTAAYLVNLATLRSVVWFIGLGCAIALIGIG